MYITKSLENVAQAPACPHSGKDLVGVANRMPISDETAVQRRTRRQRRGGV